MPLHKSEPQEDYAGGHVIDPIKGYVTYYTVVFITLLAL